MQSNIKHFILWRIIIFIPLIIGAYFVSYNNQNPVAYVFKYVNSDVSFNAVFLFPWANFDGIHYLNIAENGYTNQARFFPLFPILIKAFLSSLVLTILLISTIFFAALFFLEKLLSLDFPQKKVKETFVYLLLFPASFFFVSIYSEGLFLLFALLSFYFARKRQWFLSAFFATCLMATRFVGVAILPALIYEFLQQKGAGIKRFAFLLIIPLGLIAYSIFNFYKWGNFLYFIQAQGELGNNRVVSSIVLFPQTIFRYIKILLTVPVNSYGWGIALLEFASFFFAAFLLYFAWKKKVRTSYMIFAVINFAIVTATGTFSGLPRYVITIFPIFIALALVENKLIKLAYLIISPIVLFVSLMLFSRGYYIA